MTSKTRPFSVATKNTYNRRSSSVQSMVRPEDEDILGDMPAQMVLRDNQTKQDKRRQKETKERLSSITDRISRALGKYDLGEGDDSTDFKLDRKQSEQAFDVFIVGFNESADAKNKLLESLYNFFLIYEEDDVESSSPPVQLDLETSYQEASNALESAHDSLNRLSNIHTTLVDGYSSKLKDKENKKKTKQLAQSLKDAQHEMVALKDTLETTTKSMNEANTKAEGLRKTLEMRNTELDKNKIIIDKLRKQASESLGVDERKLLKERTELLRTIEKENTELKLHLAQLEFSNRKHSSQSARDVQTNSATEDILASLQDKMNEEREKHEESLRLVRAGVDAEIEEALERKSEEFQQEVSELKSKMEQQEETIMDLETKLADATRPVTEPAVVEEPTPAPSTPEEVETVVPATLSDRTNSAVSVDPTEALNKKYKELEEEYEKKRLAVEEEMSKNEQKNKWKIEELNNELEFAKEEWEKEKHDLEAKVESFRRMVAEMEADSQEKAHKLEEALKARQQSSGGEEARVVTPEESDHEDEERGMTPAVMIRPSTAVRNTLTPGPDNPIIHQVVTMYDHVTDFKEKLIDILAEIQNMGVIDETETMLMRRSMEQLQSVEFSSDGNVHQQISEIQSSIAQVMHGSEKTVHKIFKKLSKERGKIEQLSWVGESSPRPRSTRSGHRRSVQMCDRATSPHSHFSKPRNSPKLDKNAINASRRPPAQYTALFAHQDMEHNKRSLKQALLNHKITPKQYEEVIEMMRDYANIPQKRLQHLARHYISHARMQIMEENIHMNRPANEDIDDVLSRLDELYLLRKTRYGSDMDQLAVEREDLAYLLTKQLDRLETQSGIFLIKPYIAYKSHTLQQKQKPAVFINQTQQKSGSGADLKSEVPDSGSSWQVGASRSAPFPDWSPDIPKLLEMDCNRITVARNAISQPASLDQKSKTMKSFVVVRTSKSNGSLRARSSHGTSAEFLSIDSQPSEGNLTAHSDNLPPLRSTCTSSGFVSQNTSRQRLAPIVDPPSTLNMEKVAPVT